MRLSMFDQLISDAIESIPERLRMRLKNVAVVIADEPTEEQLRACDIADGETMYAYYEGVAQTDRDTDGEPVLPDRIIIFRAPLEEEFGSDTDALRREIAITVRHEIAHHFGIEDDRLEELGKY